MAAWWRIPARPDSPPSSSMSRTSPLVKTNYPILSMGIDLSPCSKLPGPALACRRCISLIKLLWHPELSSRKQVPLRKLKVSASVLWCFSPRCLWRRLSAPTTADSVHCERLPLLPYITLEQQTLRYTYSTQVVKILISCYWFLRLRHMQVFCSFWEVLTPSLGLYCCHMESRRIKC